MKTRFLLIAIAGFVAAIAARAELRTDLLGDAASPSDATRSVAITPSTRYVNVTHGDVVRFEVNGHPFAYRFNGAQARGSFDLRRVAPAGALHHAVIAYVSPGPMDVGAP